MARTRAERAQGARWTLPSSFPEHCSVCSSARTLIARRKPLLIGASVGRGLCLGAIPFLWPTGPLKLWATGGQLFVFGIVSVIGFAATQSLLPRIVPCRLFLAANARVDQSETAAQTVGPALGGVLVSIVTAPIAIALDAVSY